MQELIARNFPYHEVDVEPAVIGEIMNGTLPSRPAVLSDNYMRLWNICMGCWEKNPSERPTMPVVHDNITRIGRLDRTEVRDDVLRRRRRLIRCSHNNRHKRSPRVLLIS